MHEKCVSRFREIGARARATTAAGVIPRHEYIQNGQEARAKEALGRQEGWTQVQVRNLQDLHLQGLEASAPGHRYLLQGDVHHELVHQRHLREDRHGSRQARAIQQEADGHVPRNPNRGPIDLAG